MIGHHVIWQIVNKLSE